MSDRKVLASDGANVIIGFNHIKRRRLEEYKVDCHPGTMVGDYVPFYFCPRSVMLYVINKRSSELQYKGGQTEIVHLVSSVDTAMKCGQKIAFTGSNAGARYTRFHKDLRLMNEVLSWEHIRATYWADPAVREGKQAEFLVHESLPWTAITEIGTVNRVVASRVEGLLGESGPPPIVKVCPSWYY